MHSFKRSLCYRTKKYNHICKKTTIKFLNALKSTPKVMTDPAPYVEIEAFDENGLKLCVRPHSTVEDYWDVYFGAYKNVKAALGKAGIPVPYPQRKITQLN